MVKWRGKRKEVLFLIWQEKVVLSSQDADINRVLGAGAVMRIMEEAGEHQVSCYGPSSEALREEGRAFLLSRFALDYVRPLRPFEQVTVETWSCPSRGFSFLRCYRVRIGDEIVARAQARLAMVDVVDRHLLRVSDYQCGYETDEPYSPLLDDRVPRTETNVEAGRHEVRYAECDLNGHLNNTRYADLFCGFVPMEGRRVRSIVLNYLREAPMGVELSLCSAAAAEGIVLRSRLPGGEINTEAYLRLEDL